VRVVVIEDEKEIREFIASQFRERGCEVMELETGDGLMAKFEAFSPTLMLVDQMMPGKSGSDLIKEVRSNATFSNLPIMMLTGLDGEQEKVKALESGADDYVTKPFSFKEVFARASALSRRASAAHKQAQKTLVLKDLEVDFTAHRVTLKGAEVPLTLTEFKILGALLKQSGQVLTRDSLREQALGNLNVTDRTIDVHMASLRKKLESMGDVIETVRGVGYRMSL
jgi:DNA-binding response OmpR family regulator